MFRNRVEPTGLLSDKEAIGELAEWPKALAWNAGIWETVSRVRIPHSPPLS